MNIKGLTVVKKEKIVKQELIKKFPALKQKTFKLTWLCPAYFEKKKNARNGYLPTAHLRITPMATFFSIGEVEIIEEIETYGDGITGDDGGSDGNSVNVFFLVDPDWTEWKPDRNYRRKQ